jgi:repressor LexA
MSTHLTALTAKQSRFLEFIEDYCHKHGFSPSFAEIAAHFGFKSLKAVTDYVAILRREGFLRVLADRKQRNLVSTRPTGNAVERGIPILGAIAAGNPIEAIEDAEEFITPAMLGLSKGTELFGLRVKGMSMINRGIHDGDIVLIRRQSVVGRKDVAAVRVGNEVTLKYVRQEETRVRLVPDNDAMQPISIDPTADLQILGKVIRLIREEI